MGNYFTKGTRAATALEVSAVEFVRRAMRLESHLAVAVEALEIIAGKRQCLDNLMGNRDVAEQALAVIGPDLKRRKEET